LKPTGEEGFLTTGKGWLALFKGEKPGLHHYCYSIANYDPADALARLKAAGLAPKRRGDRVYFDDPDGIECQVAIMPCSSIVALKADRMKRFYSGASPMAGD
jgi:catechol 2,3-dioxygenase-like lactoylglutathione lyase family enzyme